MATNTRPATDLDPFQGIALGDLEKSLLRPRNLFGGMLSALMLVFTLIAIFPLFSVLLTVIVRGGAEIGWALFTQLPPAAFEEGGGIGNAILGTLLMVGLASLFSVPIGVLGGIFLAEVGPGTKLAHLVRFSAKVLTGFPSVLAGVFAYGAVVLATGGFSAFAGAIALSILMIPMILLTAEESIRMVPSRMREAAIGMGCNQFQVVKSILLPTAFPGILTGIMLAIARAAGETAPLLFTALFSNDWINTNGLGIPTLVLGIAAGLGFAAYALQNTVGHRVAAGLGIAAGIAMVAGVVLFILWLITGGGANLMQPTASLAVLIYNFSSSPFDNQIQMAWAAALVLVVVVLVTNLIAQGLSPKQVRR